MDMKHPPYCIRIHSLYGCMSGGVSVCRTMVLCLFILCLPIVAGRPTPAPKVKVLLEIENTTCLVTLYRDNDKLESASPSSPPGIPYDHQGAMYFAVAVISMYGLSIALLIGSTLKRNTIDYEVKGFLRSFIKLDIQKRKTEKFRIRKMLREANFVLRPIPQDNKQTVAALAFGIRNPKPVHIKYKVSWRKNHKEYKRNDTEELNNDVLSLSQGFAEYNDVVTAKGVKCLIKVTPPSLDDDTGEPPEGHSSMHSPTQVDRKVYLHPECENNEYGNIDVHPHCDKDEDDIESLFAGNECMSISTCSDHSETLEDIDVPLIHNKEHSSQCHVPLRNTPHKHNEEDNSPCPTSSVQITADKEPLRKSHAPHLRFINRNDSYANACDEFDAEDAMAKSAFSFIGTEGPSNTSVLPPIVTSQPESRQTTQFEKATDELRYIEDDSDRST